MVMSGRPSVIPSDRAGMMKYSSNADRCQLLQSVFVCRQRKIKKPPASYGYTTDKNEVNPLSNFVTSSPNKIFSNRVSEICPI